MTDTYSAMRYWEQAQKEMKTSCPKARDKQHKFKNVAYGIIECAKCRKTVYTK